MLLQVQLPSQQFSSPVANWHRHQDLQMDPVRSGRLEPTPGKMSQIDLPLKTLCSISSRQTACQAASKAKKTISYPLPDTPRQPQKWNVSPSHPSELWATAGRCSPSAKFVRRGMVCNALFAKGKR